MRPRLLDLFCGAGGAAVGYERAGFEVIGCDINPQPHYPFQFIQDDAIEFLAGITPSALAFDAIHASPPCQRFSTATKRNGTEENHPDLIAPTRELLKATGLPYVLENVVGAPLIDPQLMCGGKLVMESPYRVKRHRLFETNWPLTTPGCRCSEDDRPLLDVTGGGPTRAERKDGGGGRPYKGTADEARFAMGIDWMTKKELNEAIPPVYTKLIGKQLLAWLLEGGSRQAQGQGSETKDNEVGDGCPTWASDPFSKSETQAMEGRFHS